VNPPATCERTDDEGFAAQPAAMTHPWVRQSRRARAELPALRERVKALRYVPPLLKMVWNTHRGYAAAIFLLRVGRGFVPIATLWVGKKIIDGVIGAGQGRVPARHVLSLVALEFGIVALGEALNRAGVIENILGELFSNTMSIQLMEHAALLDLQQFEDPTFYDQMERARRGTSNRVAMFIQTLGLFESTITLVSLSAALLLQSPWLVLLLAVAVIPGFVGETHFASLNYAIQNRWTAQRRELDYLRYVAASNETAKEVQLFGLAAWLIERFRRLSDQFYEVSRRMAFQRASVTLGLSLVASIAYYVAAVVMILRAIAGTITIGTLTFLTASFQRCRGAMQGLLGLIGGIYEQTLYLNDYFEFLATKPSITSVPGAIHVPWPVREGFVFEDVGFRYPNSDRWALRHVSFTLGPGERIALVGENGAGKTTITKLLARLYDPTEGRILLDGVDLRQYDLLDVRRAIGVIFQDFVRYDLRLEENIGVGEIEQVREHFDAQWVGADLEKVPEVVAPPATVVTAAEKSLASALLPRLPGGYRQMLGRRFESGVNLSGGEWQKVALARAYMRDAQVLILDEPTAALDARAEYDVFVRFNELMAGRMAVVISHRFSTVRMADRIIVLKDGTVVEEGSHAELVRRGGLYAELFELQAAGYG
jgi:ATP-binding cassette subfamily B protein